MTNQDSAPHVLYFSRGRGRGHAFPDLAVMESLYVMRPDIVVRMASYGMGAGVLRAAALVAAKLFRKATLYLSAWLVPPADDDYRRRMDAYLFAVYGDALTYADDIAVMEHAGLFLELAATRRNLLFNFKSTAGYVPQEVQRELGVSPEYWAPRLTDHYRFVLTRPELDGILCSPLTPDHVQELVEAMQTGPLDDDEEQHVLFLGMLAQGKASMASTTGSPSRP